MEIPKRLYKYQAYNHYSLANLKNNHIYFNSALNFNDPYDCLHALSFEKLSDGLIQTLYLKSSPDERMRLLVKELFNNEISSIELVEFYRSFISENPNLAHHLRLELDIDPDEYFSNLEHMILHEGHFELFRKNAIEALTEKANNSVRTGIDEIRSNMASQHGICCFSETPDDMLMW